MIKTTFLVEFEDVAILYPAGLSDFVFYIFTRTIIGHFSKFDRNCWYNQYFSRNSSKIQIVAVCLRWQPCHLDKHVDTFSGFN